MKYVLLFIPPPLFLSLCKASVLMLWSVESSDCLKERQTVERDIDTN